MFVIRVGKRGSVIWYGPRDVVTLPNALGAPDGLEHDVRAALNRPSTPLMARGRRRDTLRPMKPGTPAHALEALLSLPGAQLMHADVTEASMWSPGRTDARLTGRHVTRESSAVPT